MSQVYDDLFETITSYQSLHRAFYKSIKRKGCRQSIAKFAVNLEENILQISQELKGGTYQFGPYRSFFVHEPKTRLIESAWFRDRVVHHALHEVLETIYDPIFIEHTYACRSGRGHHAAMLKLHQWMQGDPNRYFLKCDIKKIFPSIDRTILIGIISRKIKDTRLLNCIENLIHTAPGGKGIPIGNLTSQLFANIYLNELDQFIKRKLKVHHYIRYMDDFICLVKPQNEALNLRVQIQEFLFVNLNLELSPQKVMIGPTKMGMSFLGFHLTPKRIRLKGVNLRKMRKKVDQCKNKEELLSTVISYLGHIKHCTYDKSMAEFMMGKILEKNGGVI